MPARLFGTSTVTGAIGSSRLTSAIAAPSRASARAPYGVASIRVVTGSSQHSAPTPRVRVKQRQRHAAPGEADMGRRAGGAVPVPGRRWGTGSVARTSLYSTEAYRHGVAW